MLPADRVLVGGLRWLDLLERSRLTQAWAIISNDPRYADLTRTQYHAALEWLRFSGLLVDAGDGVELSAALKNLSPTDISVALMARAIELDEPAWLADADALVLGPVDLPQDAEKLAEALHLDAAGALQAVRRAQRKVDLDARARIGAAGETALLDLLEQHWPGSTTHVAATDDTAGYDIAFTYKGRTQHLEVKTSNRRGRLVIYLSRHEFQTGLADPSWLLVVAGLDEMYRLAALATVRGDVLRERSPRDAHEATGWASARFVLARADLQAGLQIAGITTLVLDDAGTPFAWMPSIG